MPAVPAAPASESGRLRQGDGAYGRGDRHRRAGVTFASLGARRLKGLAEEVELFEVRPDGVPRGERARDPVCGMEMAPGQVAATLLVNGQTLALCCEKCLRLFLDASRQRGG